MMNSILRSLQACRMLPSVSRRTSRRRSAVLPQKSLKRRSLDSLAESDSHDMRSSSWLPHTSTNSSSSSDGSCTLLTSDMASHSSLRKRSPMRPMKSKRGQAGDSRCCPSTRSHFSFGVALAKTLRNRAVRSTYCISSLIASNSAGAKDAFSTVAIGTLRQSSAGHVHSSS